MKKAWYLGLLSALLIKSVYADIPVEPLLNQVTMQLSAEQWVATKTALVTASVNASVNDAGLEKIQNDVLAKLNQISNKGEWHIVSFNRSQDQSGLEKVQILAQARLASTDLVGLRDRAKSMTKPGETFSIDNIEFTPSAEELRVANAALRANIYQQVRAEMTDLNKLYPEDKYYLHSVIFMNDTVPTPQPFIMAKTANMMSASADTRNGGNLAVGNKLRLTANVVLATAPNADVAKMVVQK